MRTFFTIYRFKHAIPIILIKYIQFIQRRIPKSFFLFKFCLQVKSWFMIFQFPNILPLLYYSLRSDRTGFIRADFIDWKPTVRAVIMSAATAAITYTSGLIAIR